MAIDPTPSSVVIDDFDRDGHQDLAITLAQTAGVSIWRGRGDGRFDLVELNYALGPDDEAVSLAVGDFNNDGIKDLAVACFLSGRVSILYGMGDGHFSRTATQFAVPLFSQDIRVADVNGDKIDDLIVVSDGGPTRRTGRVSILLGRGDGTFEDAVNFSSGDHSINATVGDFNEDGVLDLAVANFGELSTGIGSNLSIFIGNGDGTFRTGATLDVGRNPTWVASIDINRDAHRDLVVSSLADNRIFLLLGDGNGEFQSLPSLPTRSSPTGIAVGDFNNDGLDDFAVPNMYSVTVSAFIHQE